MSTRRVVIAAINAKYIHSNPAVYSLAAYAGGIKQGIEVAEFTIHESAEEILRDLYGRRPSMLCFSCYIWNITLVESVCRAFHKLRPEVPIWLGGPEVSYETESYLAAHPEITGIMTGEGEFSFSQLVHGVPLSEVEAVTWRDETGSVITNPRLTLLQLDDLPFCYADLSIFENRIVYYESSRGCPFSCSYCLSSIDKSLRFKSLPVVYRELQYFLDNRIPQVKFVDRTFNCNHAHAQGIWQYIREHDNGVTNFHFEISADLLNEEELRLLSDMRSGLIRLEIGVQSTNADTIAEIRRTMQLDRVQSAVQQIQSFRNIHQHLDLIAGLPMEGLQSFRRSFDEIYRWKPEQLQLGFLKVLKGSYMYEKADDYGILYGSEPPYEVMQTKWLSYEELQQIKLVEEMLELHYNSGQFLTALRILERRYESPFDMFLALGSYYVKQHLLRAKHTRLRRYEIFYAFAGSVDEEGKALYAEALTYDLYVREKAKVRPSWAHDLEPFKADIRNALRDMGFEKKYCHAEVFHYPVHEQDAGALRKEAYREQPYILLFDYENRNAQTREAAVRELDVI